MTPEQKVLFDRMTQLQQRVAINVLAGMSQRQAYYAAGGSATSDESADATVSALLSNAKVSEFMDSMKMQAVSDAVMSRQEALEKLSILGRTDLKDIVRFETKEIGRDLETGEPLFQTGWFIPESIQEEDPAKLSIISELEVGRFGPKIKTHSPMAAIAQLAKMMGWESAQKSEITITRSAGDLTDDELAAILAAEAEQADNEG